jgi:hypothetical protein
LNWACISWVPDAQIAKEIIYSTHLKLSNINRWICISCSRADGS